MTHLPVRLFFAGLLLFPNTVHAGTHYVREGAAGDQTGRDWANAYAVLPAVLVRGDVYYLAAGDYGAYAFKTPEAGSTLITLKKATQKDHGTETGWRRAYAAGPARFDALAFATGYCIITGQTRDSDWQSGYGIVIDDPRDSHRALVSVATKNNVSHIALAYVEIAGHGVDNTVHEDGIYAPGPHRNFSVSYSYLHDFGRAPLITGFADGWLFEYNYVARNSSDPSKHSAGWADEASDNVVIRYNYWADIEGTSYIDILNRGPSSPGLAENWQIYGNVFFYTQANAARRTGVGNGAIAVINRQSAKNWRIYNNSFINIPGWSARVYFGNTAAEQHHSETSVQNNLWYRCSIADHIGVSQASHNLYIETRHSKTEPAMQVYPAADPTVFVDYAGRDFRLRQRTAAGVALERLFARDMRGVERGQDGIWDRGAFEFAASPSSDGQPPGAPSGLSIRFQQKSE